MNQTEPCPSSGYPPYLLSSGVADKPDLTKLLECCSHLGRGVGAQPPFFFPFSQDYFYSPQLSVGVTGAWGTKLKGRLEG